MGRLYKLQSAFQTFESGLLFFWKAGTSESLLLPFDSFEHEQICSVCISPVDVTLLRKRHLLANSHSIQSPNPHVKSESGYISP